MKIKAKGIISTDPFVASQVIATNQTEVTEQEVEKLKDYKNKQLTQGQNVKVPFSASVPLPSSNPFTGTIQSGGAVYPGTPDGFATSGISIPSTEELKTSGLDFLSYSYALDFIGGDSPSLPTSSPQSFIADIYLTIGVYNGSFNYEFLKSGLVDKKDKWEVWNSFKVGVLISDTTLASPTALALYSDSTSQHKIKGIVNWTDTLLSRPISSISGLGGGIIFYDFIDTDPTKITIDQFRKIVDGSIDSLLFSFSIRNDNLTVAQSNYLNLLLPELIFSPKIRFFGATTMSNFN